MEILLKVKVTLWLFNIAMENGPFIDGLPINLDPLLIKVPLIKRMPALGTFFFNCFSIPPIENQYYMSRE